MLLYISVFIISKLFQNVSLIELDKECRIECNKVALKSQQVNFKRTINEAIHVKFDVARVEIRYKYRKIDY